MGPMSVQGLWAGGTLGGLCRKRFPLGREVLLEPEPAPCLALCWVPLAGFSPSLSIAWLWARVSGSGAAGDGEHRGWGDSTRTQPAGVPTPGKSSTKLGFSSEWLLFFVLPIEKLKVRRGWETGRRWVVPGSCKAKPSVQTE